MEKPIIKLQADVLLDKFGAGSHKPGSGSAVALQGMLSAQLIKTVIDLSIEKKKFKVKVEDLIFINDEIKNKIYPALEDLIQKDAVQFDKVIVARKARDEEKNIALKSQYALEALNELMVAIEIPMEIAKHCIRLADFAIFIFDNAFQAVRGDSSVAINGAISAVAGCLSIVNLNLLSFTSDEWTEKMRNEAEFLMKNRDRLLIEEGERQLILKDEADKIHNFHLEIMEFQKELQLNPKVTSAQLEDFATNIQRTMWLNRDWLWKKKTSDSAFNILDPKKLLRQLGYQYQQHPSLGHHEVQGDVFEVAGVIDSEKKHVSI